MDPNPLDWKLAVLLIGHLLAVGVMYGSISTNIDNTKQNVQKIETRLDRIESRMWGRPGAPE